MIIYGVPKRAIHPLMKPSATDCAVMLRIGRWPAGESVDASEQVSIALRVWKWPNKVEMDYSVRCYPPPRGVWGHAPPGKV